MCVTGVVDVWLAVWTVFHIHHHSHGGPVAYMMDVDHMRPYVSLPVDTQRQ